MCKDLQQSNLNHYIISDFITFSRDRDFNTYGKKCRKGSDTTWNLFSKKWYRLLFQQSVVNDYALTRLILSVFLCTSFYERKYLLEKVVSCPKHIRKHLNFKKIITYKLLTNTLNMLNTGRLKLYVVQKTENS